MYVDSVLVWLKGNSLYLIWWNTRFVLAKSLYCNVVYTIYKKFCKLVHGRIGYVSGSTMLYTCHVLISGKVLSGSDILRDHRGMVDVNHNLEYVGEMSGCSHQTRFPSNPNAVHISRELCRLGEMNNDILAAFSRLMSCGNRFEITRSTFLWSWNLPLCMIHVWSSCSDNGVATDCRNLILCLMFRSLILIEIYKTNPLGLCVSFTFGSTWTHIKGFWRCFLPTVRFSLTIFSCSTDFPPKKIQHSSKTAEPCSSCKSSRPETEKSRVQSHGSSKRMLLSVLWTTDETSTLSQADMISTECILVL